MLDPGVLERLLHVTDDGPTPALHDQVSHRAHFGQFNVGIDIVLFVPDERERKFRLVDPQLSKVVVDHRALKLGHLYARGLYAIAICYVDKVDLCHRDLLCGLLTI